MTGSFLTDNFLSLRWFSAVPKETWGFNHVHFFLHIRALYRWPQIMSATRAVMRWERFASEASFPRHAKCDLLQTSNPSSDPFLLPVYMDSRSLQCFIWQSVALSWQAEDLKAILSQHCAEVAAWLPLGLLGCLLVCSRPIWLSPIYLHWFTHSFILRQGGGGVWFCVGLRALVCGGFMCA